LYGNQYCSEKDAPPKNVYEADQELGLGSRPPGKKKFPGICLGRAWQQVELNQA